MGVSEPDITDPLGSPSVLNRDYFIILSYGDFIMEKPYLVALAMSFLQFYITVLLYNIDNDYMLCVTVIY